MSYCRELYSREKLDSYLSRALNIPLENGKLGVVDDCGYVLTLDFAIKMLNIHERAECRVPVIIEGETGVGKTALVEMLSKLWNCSLTQTWKTERSRMVDFINSKINGENVCVKKNKPCLVLAGPLLGECVGTFYCMFSAPC